jgi:hypothetical protein
VKEKKKKTYRLGERHHPHARSRVFKNEKSKRKK